MCVAVCIPSRPLHQLKIGVLPLSKKLNEGAEKVFAELSKTYNCEFDDRGSIGKTLSPSG